MKLEHAWVILYEANKRMASDSHEQDTGEALLTIAEQIVNDLHRLANKKE